MPVRTISVVIPLYNKEATIDRALLSVASQTEPVDEIVVVDDGSTDQSANRVAAFCQKHPNTAVRLISQVNQGVSAARNTGVRAARSRFIALLDADDSYEPEFIFEIRQLLAHWPEAVAFCTAYQFRRPDQRARKAYWYGMRTRSERGLLPSYFRMTANGDLPVTSSSVCVNRDMLHKVGGFPTGQQMGEDQWLWSLLALRGPIAYSKRVLSNYYLEAQNSLMNSLTPASELPFSCMLQDLLDSGRYQGELARDIAAMIRTHLYDLVRRSFAQQRYKDCAALLGDSRLSDWSARKIYWHLRLLLRNNARESRLLGRNA